MVAWTDYTKTARERGALALELYVVTSTPAKRPEDVKENLASHLGYQRELEERGVLVLAGPVSDPTGEEMIGAGMIIYRAASMDEARQLAANDPMHLSGARSYSLNKWLVNEGSITLNVGLSTGRVMLA